MINTLGMSIFYWKMSIVNALAHAFWYRLISMTLGFLLSLCLALPLLDYGVLCWRQVYCLWECLKSLCFVQYALSNLPLWYWFKQLICSLWSISCHIWWFFWLFLIHLPMNLSPILRLLVHFTVRRFCLCTNLIE